jgi:Cu-Zn family superoxide dismutase
MSMSRSYLVRTASLSVKVFILLVVTVGPFATANSDGGPKLTAISEIQGCADAAVSGKAELEEKWSEEGIKIVKVKLEVRGLPDGKHAVHIHETASCEPCGSAGGHFDPGPSGSSNPDGNHPFHSGDLINVNVKNGEGRVETRTSRVTLSPGPLSLFDNDGSAFVIHVDEDTYCPEGAVPGCAGGGRAACGIINLMP